MMKYFFLQQVQQKPVDKMTTGNRRNTPDDGLMDDQHRNILRGCREDLVKDMEPLIVLRSMTNQHLFTAEDESEIKAKETREKQCELLLEKLARKGARAYETFKETIEKVHPHLKNTILNAGK